MIRPESPYRRPVRLRPASDAFGAFCALLCLAAVAVGAGVALAACDAIVRHGGGSDALAIALAGLAILLAGTACGVLLGGGRRG